MQLEDFLLSRNLQETKKVTVGGDFKIKVVDEKGEEVFKDFEFEIRPLTNDVWENCRKSCMNIDVKQGVSLNLAKLNAMVVIEGTVYPNFRDANLISRAGCTLPMDLVNAKLKPGEIEKLANEITKFSGFGNEGEIPKK